MRVEMDKTRSQMAIEENSRLADVCFGKARSSSARGLLQRHPVREARHLLQPRGRPLLLPPRRLPGAQPRGPLAAPGPEQATSRPPSSTAGMRNTWSAWEGSTSAGASSSAPASVRAGPADRARPCRGHAGSWRACSRMLGWRLREEAVCSWISRRSPRKGCASTSAATAPWRAPPAEPAPPVRLRGTAEPGPRREPAGPPRCRVHPHLRPMPGAVPFQLATDVEPDLVPGSSGPEEGSAAEIEVTDNDAALFACPEEGRPGRAGHRANLPGPAPEDRCAARGVWACAPSAGRTATEQRAIASARPWIAPGAAVQFKKTRSGN